MISFKNFKKFYYYWDFLLKIVFKEKDLLTLKSIDNVGNMSVATYSYFNDKKSLTKIKNIYYLWNYDKDFRKLIYEYKFNQKKKLARDIAKLIYIDIKRVIVEEKIDFVIAVPISKKRKSERGFNQVHEILKCLNIKYIELKKIKNTVNMYKLLDTDKRKENIKGSFYLGNHSRFCNKNILIVDDIITTGSTIKEIINTITSEFSNDEVKNIKFTIFCLAAANELKKKKGDI